MSIGEPPRGLSRLCSIERLCVFCRRRNGQFGERFFACQDSENSFDKPFIGIRLGFSMVMKAARWWQPVVAGAAMARGRSPADWRRTSISRMGFPARRGTAVLPTCSMVNARPSSAFARRELRIVPGQSGFVIHDDHGVVRNSSLSCGRSVHFLHHFLFNASAMTTA